MKHIRSPVYSKLVSLKNKITTVTLQYGLCWQLDILKTKQSTIIIFQLTKVR